MQNRNASKKIAHNFVNLFKKAEQSRLLTNNMSKKFTKMLGNLYNNANKTRAGLALASLKRH